MGNGLDMEDSSSFNVLWQALFPTRKLETYISLLVFTVRARSEVFVPKGVDDAQDGEATGDNHKALVGRGRTLWRDVLVLAPFEHTFVNTVQADAIGVGFSRYLVELCG